MQIFKKTKRWEFYDEFYGFFYQEAERTVRVMPHTEGINSGFYLNLEITKNL